MSQLLLEHKAIMPICNTVWVGPDGGLHSQPSRRPLPIASSEKDTLSDEARTEIRAMWAAMPPTIIRDFSNPHKPRLRVLLR